MVYVEFEFYICQISVVLGVFEPSRVLEPSKHAEMKILGIFL